MDKKTKEKTAISLSELFFEFFKIGLMMFGGGAAMLPLLEREIVENKMWADREEISNYFAIGQCTPGIIAVNCATFIGVKMRKTIGGIVSTVGVIAPSMIIISIIAVFLSNVSELEYVNKAFLGIRVCVVVLILNAVLRLWKSAVVGKTTLIVFLLTLTISLVFKASPVAFVLFGIVLGIIIESFARKKDKDAS